MAILRADRVLLTTPEPPPDIAFWFDGAVRAVDDLTFDVRPGKVTGFLGPNGAGKSTTMRMVLGLDRPTSGQALVGGRPFGELAEPLRAAGALLDAQAVHPGRSGRDHLQVAARTHGLPDRRVDAVIDQVGLGPAATRRVKGYSLGMRQRLGIAGALLGDPAVLLFDEPMNGLDLDGVRWIRRLVRGLADEGRTVLLSSHILAEAEALCDRVSIIRHGRTVQSGSLDELRHLTRTAITAETARPATGLESLAGVHDLRHEDGRVRFDVDTDALDGALRHLTGLGVVSLTSTPPTLEELFLRHYGDELAENGAAAREPVRS